MYRNHDRVCLNHAKGTEKQESFYSLTSSDTVALWSVQNVWINMAVGKEDISQVKIFSITQEIISSSSSFNCLKLDETYEFRVKGLT